MDGGAPYLYEPAGDGDSATKTHGQVHSFMELRDCCAKELGRLLRSSKQRLMEAHAGGVSRPLEEALERKITARLLLTRDEAAGFCRDSSYLGHL